MLLIIPPVLILLLFKVSYKCVHINVIWSLVTLCSSARHMHHAFECITHVFEFDIRAHTVPPPLNNKHHFSHSFLLTTIYNLSNGSRAAARSRPFYTSSQSWCLYGSNYSLYPNLCRHAFSQALGPGRICYMRRMSHLLP